MPQETYYIWGQVSQWVSGIWSLCQKKNFTIEFYSDWSCQILILERNPQNPFHRWDTRLHKIRILLVYSWNNLAFILYDSGAECWLLIGCCFLECQRLLDWRQDHRSLELIVWQQNWCRPWTRCSHLKNIHLPSFDLFTFLARGQVKCLWTVLGAEISSPTPEPKHGTACKSNTSAQLIQFSFPWIVVEELPGVHTCPPSRCKWLLRVWTEASALADPPGHFWRMRGCVGFHLVWILPIICSPELCDFSLKPIGLRLSGRGPAPW